MDAWLLTDDQQLALRVHEALARIRVSCPESRVVNIASLDQVTPQLAESSELFVFAVRQFHESHTDLIQRVRITFTGTLVIVAALPTQSTLLRAIRAGADDFIDADGPLDAELADLVARLESQSVCADADSHLITIIPCLSTGDGNFLAVNIAAVLARRSGGCVLLDFHMRGGDLAMMLQLAPKHTFLELVRQRRNIDQSMLEQALTQHDSGIKLLAGPDMFSEMQDIQLHVSQQILDIAKSLSPYVIVGIEDIQHAEQVHAVAKCETVVLACRTDLVSLYRTKRHVEFLLKYRVPLERICIVAISSGHDGELPIGTFRKVLSTSQVHFVPDDPKAVMLATNVGSPLVYESPKSKTSRALTDLVDWLCHRQPVAPIEIKSPTSRGAVAASLSWGPHTINK